MTCCTLPREMAATVCSMPVPPPNERFEAALASWQNWLQHNRGRSAATVEKYIHHVLRLRQWCQSPPDDKKLRASTADVMALTPADLDLFAGLYAHSLKLTPRSRRPLVSALRGFFAYASINNFAPDNAAARLSQPKVGRPLPHAMPLDQAERLLMAPGLQDLAGYRDTAIIAMLAGTAARVSGLCSLNESALLWESDDSGLRLSVRLTEKGKRERIVPVPDEAAMLLRAYLDHPDLVAIDRSLGTGDSVVFVSLQAPSIPAHEYYGERRRLARSSVLRMIKTRAKAAKVDAQYAHPHALRHLYGAELAEDDVDLVKRQALLGHVSAETTSIYTHLAKRKLRELVDRSNPLAKMRSAPVLGTVRALRSALRAPSRPPATTPKT